MLQLDATWMDNISKRIWPTPLLVIKAAGNRVYSNRDVSDITASVFGPTEEPVISFENRVISFGQITKKVFDFSQTIVQGFSKKTLQIATVVLNNSDREVSVLVNRERWHNRPLQIYLAYADSTTKLKIFEGVIQDIAYSLDRGTITLKATETGYDQVFKPVGVIDLTPSTFVIAEGYVIGSNDKIPVVYGNINDTASPNIGAWKAAYLGTVPLKAYYGYASHEVVSLPENLPRIWFDGQETTNFLFFSNSTRFETPSGNNIALIETSLGLGSGRLTIQGMGKPSSAGSTALMENLVDIITDFVQVENDNVFQIDPTNSIDSKTFLESTIFAPSTIFPSIVAPGRSAGVITQDIPIWTQIQEMLSGLGGTAFLASDDGELKFIIDQFIRIPDSSLIISRGDILNTQTISRIKNIYNSIDSQYAWMPAQNQFGLSGAIITSSSSINHYGTRKLTVRSKWSWTGQDGNFLKDPFSSFNQNVSRAMDIITCTIANPVIMQIEPGLDYLYLTFENLVGTDGEMKINEFCKVLSIKFLLDQNKAELTVMDTNQWKDDGAGSRDMTLY